MTYFVEHRWEQLKNSTKLRANLEARAKLLSAIRKFFDERGYVEMETPLMVAKPGMEPYLDPFETTLTTPTGESHDAFLITSPEYSLKKLVAAGFPRIYQLGKCFRNLEGSGGRHNPEFTMLEWYRTGTDYRGIMDETEELFVTTGKAFGKEFSTPFERLTVEEAFQKFAGKSALELAPDEGEYHKVFLNEVEPKLGIERPTFLYDYPASMAALSRPAKDPRFAERFEMYVNGLELANTFSELIDPAVQRARFEQERAFRARLGKTDIPIDNELIAALAEMPETGGISVGVDRLLMLLVDAKDIREVIAFPTDSMFEKKIARRGLSG